MPRVYVMGPMSGYPELNSEIFSAAFAYLTDRGYHTVSPHHIERPLRPADRDTDMGKGEIYRQVMPMDLFALASADMVIALPGWEQSPGCGLERHAADLFDIPVYALDSDEGDGTLTEWLDETMRLVDAHTPLGQDYGSSAFHWEDHI